MGGTAAFARWLALAACLGGCTYTGAIAGRLEAPGMQPKPIEMSYTTERFGSGGTINTTLPTGEYFTGRYLQITSESTADTFGPGWGGWGPWNPFWGDWGGGDYATFVQNYTGKVIATLFGDQKNTMRCRFALADPAEGMTGGGVGECQITNGETIQAQF
ncbi:MAG: hypothetical protein AB1689_16665 [Thermodesulfobacteriota bacterium]